MLTISPTSNVSYSTKNLEFQNTLSFGSRGTFFSKLISELRRPAGASTVKFDRFVSKGPKKINAGRFGWIEVGVQEGGRKFLIQRDFLGRKILEIFRCENGVGSEYAYDPVINKTRKMIYRYSSGSAVEVHNKYNPKTKKFVTATSRLKRKHGLYP